MSYDDMNYGDREKFYNFTSKLFYKFPQPLRGGICDNFLEATLNFLNNLRDNGVTYDENNTYWR